MSYWRDLAEALGREREREATAPEWPPEGVEEERRCRCKHDTSDPELGCTCGYADWLSDEGLSTTDDVAVPCGCCSDDGLSHDHSRCQHVCCPDWDDEA